MSELQLFNFNDHEIRTVTSLGETWFIVKDVCDALGIGNARDAATRLDRDDVG